MSEETGGKQLLHLVFGGELKDLGEMQFRNLKELDIVGIFPDYQSALTAWRGRPSQPWTMRICATSSSTCTGFSIRPTRIDWQQPGMKSTRIAARAAFLGRCLAEKGSERAEARRREG